MLRFLLVLICMAVFGAHAAKAESPPVPQRKTGDLQSVRKDLEKHEAAQPELEKQLKQAGSELEKTKSELVAIAAEARENEEELERLEKRIDVLTVEEAEITGRLEQDYGSIAELILALERMRRIPPEALVVRPGAPLATAQSAMLLQGTLPAIKQRVEDLSGKLQRLSDIEKTLKTDRASVLKTKAEFDARLAEIRTLTEKRETLYGKTRKDYEQNKKNIERLSREAKTLMELIARIEEQQDRQKVAYIPPTPMPTPGQTLLPVAGMVVESYGTRNAFGATSQGITIETRPGSVAVAPMGGIVRFAGAFKNYGNMVIIEHKGGYHSLIAGLQRIDAPLEGAVKAGEPIGQLPQASSRGGRPALYYELRYNGQPVDPAKKLAGIKS